MAQTLTINGVEYTGISSIQIPKADDSGNAVFFDTTTANAVSSNILQGKRAYVGTGEISGSMTNNGYMQGGIAEKDGYYTIPAGYTSGGIVRITANEKNKIISGNIRCGVTILGVSGKSSVVDTSDATATAEDIALGKTAYINGVKVTGTAS